MVNEVPLFLRILIQHTTLSLAAFLINIGSALCALFTIFSAFRKKDKKSLVFLMSYLLAAAILIILASEGRHSLKERHFPWMASFFAFSIAFTFSFFRKHPKRSIRIATGIAAAVFFISLLSESYQIGTQTFKIDSIAQWLSKNGISKRLVTTSWWQLNTITDTENVSLIPLYIETKGKIPKELWFLDSPRIIIAWELLSRAYQQHLLRYLITSGLASRIEIGSNELLLKNITPLMSWPHPYSSFNRRPYYIGGSYRICLYDLKTVFSQANIQQTLKTKNAANPENKL